MKAFTLACRFRVILAALMLLLGLQFHQARSELARPDLTDQTHKDEGLWERARRAFKDIFRIYSPSSSAVSSTILTESVISAAGEGSRTESEPLSKEAEEKVISALQSAKIMLEEGKIGDEVVDILLSALEIDPENSEGNNILGATLLAMKKPELAEAFLYKAVDVSNWTDHSSVANLAESLRLSGELSLAILVAERGLQNSTDHSGMLSFTLASVYAAQRNYTASAEWYLAVALKQPENTEAWLRASTLMFPAEHVQLNFAENVLIQAIKLNPQDSQLMYYMGLALQRAGKNAEALPFYAETVRLDPENKPVLANIASTLHSLGRLNEAVQYYESSLGSNPGNTAVLINYAVLLSSNGHPERAIRLAQRAIDLSPGEGNIETLANVVVQNAKVYGDRVQSFQQEMALAVRSNDLDRVIALANAFGEPVENGAWWYFNVGMSMLLRGEYQQALQFCDRVGSNASPMDIQVLARVCLGISALNLGDGNVAVDQLERAWDIVRRASAAASQPPPALVSHAEFSVPVRQLQVEILAALSAIGNHQRCLDWTVEFFKFPELAKGGILMTELSKYDWSNVPEEVVSVIRQIEEAEAKSGNFETSVAGPLIDLLKKIQRDDPRLVQARKCLAARQEAADDIGLAKQRVYQYAAIFQ